MKNLINRMTLLFALSFLLNSFTLISPPEEGIATIMDEAMQGKKTSCSSIYDKNQKTASHATLACGTKLKVTNLATKKSVEVTVINKGTFAKGQVIALSTSAAAVIEVSKKGDTKVKIEVISPQNEVKKETVKTNENKPKSNNSKSKSKDPELNIVDEAATMEKGGLYKMEILKLEPKGYGVQVAGYSDYEAVVQQVSVLQKKWFKGALVFVDALNNKPYYKVIMGPFFTKEEADSYCENIKTKYGVKDAFTVNLESLSGDSKK